MKRRPDDEPMPVSFALVAVPPSAPAKASGAPAAGVASLRVIRGVIFEPDDDEPVRAYTGTVPKDKQSTNRLADLQIENDADAADAAAAADDDNGDGEDGTAQDGLFMAHAFVTAAAHSTLFE
jgi:hypothetical protein